MHFDHDDDQRNITPDPRKPHTLRHEKQPEITAPILSIHTKPEILARSTAQAKLELENGQGLPERLQGSWLDVSTHYSYTKALEEGVDGLSRDEVKELGNDMSRRMDATMRIMAKENMLDPITIPLRQKNGHDSTFYEGAALMPELGVYVITNPSLALGDAKRRVFTTEEFYEIYESTPDWD